MTKTNEALAKAAEELSQGLAKDEPLEVMGAGRERLGAAIRMSSGVVLVRELKGRSLSHERALLAIIQGPYLMEKKPWPQTMDLLKVPGQSLEDFHAKKEDALRDYNAWLKFTSSQTKTRRCAEGPLAECLSFTQIAFEVGLTDKTVKRRAMQVIDAWAKALSGESLVNRPDQPIYTAPARGEFVATKYFRRNERGQMEQYKPYELVDNE